MATIGFLPAPLRRIMAALLAVPAAQLGEDDFQLNPISPRVLLVVYDPVIDPISGQKLSQRMHWQNVDALVKNYIDDLAECSGGLVQYRVVERMERNEFPPKTGGFRYDSTTYFQRPEPPHAKDWADYSQIIQDLSLLDRVSRNEIDEVWIFNFPYAGFYESTMAGRLAFECNSGPRPGTSRCPRRFVIMGFSSERFGGQMLENFGHRVEAIMGRVYLNARGDDNLFARFSRYDKSNPGNAEVGSVHFGPNSERDYDYSNQKMVPSRCDDWLTFPNFPGTVKQVNCMVWGTDPGNPQDPWTRPHHKWFLSHLPRAIGRTNGVANNWWKYIINPNLV